MDKTAHHGRRKARITYLEKELQGDPYTVYTDVAMYKNNHDAVATVTDSNYNLVDCLTIKNTNPKEAEAAAIALALTNVEAAEESAHNYGLDAHSTTSLKEEYHEWKQS